MEKWRLIIDPPHDGHWNMAADYSILKSVSNGSAPTLRFYRWNCPAITIGYFQIIDEEVNSAACKKNNIPVIRRITGGGAVFHDHEITYSISIPLHNPLITGTIIDSYKLIITPIIAALKNYGIDAEYSPINDILVNSKKISGNAQTRREGVLLQHGTLLLSADIEKMFTYLNVSINKIKDKGISDPRERITAVKDYLGDKVFNENFLYEFINSIINTYKEQFKIEFYSDSLNSEEILMSNEMVKKIFNNYKWNNKRDLLHKSIN